MKTHMSDKEITQQLEHFKGWLWNEDKLKKNYTFNNFREAMAFVFRVSYEAEEINHHPEIFNCYNRVELALNTHEAGGKVTGKDFDLARAIDKIA